MSNYDRPHTYDKAPCPSAKMHRAQQPEPTEAEEQGRQQPQGRRAAK